VPEKYLQRLNVNLTFCISFPSFTRSPSILNVPVDLALGVVIPYHFYSGMSHTIHDYFHLKPWYGLAKIALLVIVALMILGFLNLNLRGEGTFFHLQSVVPFLVP
jgi:succinate dehydrogenase hydrophobic anchor subunit